MDQTMLFSSLYWLFTILLMNIFVGCSVQKHAISATSLSEESHLLPREEREKLQHISEILHARSHVKECRRFREEYLSLYNKLQQQPESQKRYLILIPVISGIADRMAGITSVFAFSILSERIFLIGQRPPLIPLESLFTSPYINWSRPERDPDWILAPLAYHPPPVEINYNASILAEGQYYAVNALVKEPPELYQSATMNVMLGNTSKHTFILSNRGRIILMYQDPVIRDKFQALGLSPRTTTGCFIDFLFTPKPFIFLPIYNEMVKIHTSQQPSSTNHTATLIIAVQIRTGDKALMSSSQDHHTVAQFEAFFSCAKQIEDYVLSHPSPPNTEEPLYRDAKWYLVSDSMHLRHDAVRVFGADKIITSTDIKLEHMAKESNVCQKDCDVSLIGAATAAAEWWLMSYARYHIITPSSGFGRIAAMHSLHENSVFSLGRAVDQNLVCNPTSTYTPLEKLAQEWAGI